LAMEAHKDVHGDKIVPYAMEENMWMGIEELFMKSPATRNLVKTDKLKVVAGVYDVGTGKVKWLSTEKVDEIFKRVEASPDKETVKDKR